MIPANLRSGGLRGQISRVHKALRCLAPGRTPPEASLKHAGPSARPRTQKFHGEPHKRVAFWVPMFLPVYADLSSDFRVEIREEVRARMVQTTGVLVAPLSKEATFSPTAKARQLVIDSELQPLLKYRTSNARTVFSLQYNPRLVLTNLAAKDEPYALVYTGDRHGRNAKIF